MKDNITISSVAKHAGVSISTVSRVMNGTANVSPEVHAKVKKAIEELKYHPNIHARNIKGGQKTTIGLVVPSVSDNFFSKIVEGVLFQADKLGLRIIVFSCHGEEVNEHDCLKTAAQSGIDGLLYCPSSVIATQHIHDVFPKDFPLIILYRRGLASDIPHIYHDNVNGGYLPAKYLLKHGHKNIAFFASFWHFPLIDTKIALELYEGEDRGAYTSLDRLCGHIRALEENNIDFNPNLLVSTGYTYQHGYESAKEFLSKIYDFDAVICSNDSVAAGVLQALTEANIPVPEKVSIVGYDDSVLATIARPMLTTVKQEPKRLGRESVEMMHQLVNGASVSDRVVDISLVIRNSTATK